MPLIPEFSVTQDFSDLDILVISDTSTGSDGGVAKRRVYLVAADGTPVVPANSTTTYVEWSYSTSQIRIGSILDRDYSIEITIQWISSDNGILQFKTKIVALTGYADAFLLDLTRANASNPKLLNSKSYFERKSKLRCLLDDAIQAADAGQQASSQLCLNEAGSLIQYEAYTF